MTTDEQAREALKRLEAWIARSVAAHKGHIKRDFRKLRVAIPRLWSDSVMRDALRIAHAKMSLVSSINKEYDSELDSGESRGTIKIRMPQIYTRRGFHV